jgi:hypothetical protein
MPAYLHDDRDITSVLTGPDPSRATASGEYNSNEAIWMAFAHDGGSGKWSNTAGQTTGWLQWDCGAGVSKSIDAYTVTSRNDGYATSMMSTWILYGSNDGATWDVLDSQADIPWTSNPAEMRIFNLATRSGPYRYFRISGSSLAYACAIGELELIDASSVSIPPAGIILSGHIPTPWGGISRAFIPVASLVLTAPAPDVQGISRVDIPPAGIILSGHIPTPWGGISRAFIPVASLVLTAPAPSYSWAPGNAHRSALQVIYLCVLTGNADGLDDITIPMSSFQSTLRNGDPSYLACVIPNSVDYINEIILRTHGDIVVKKGYRYADGSINAEEICRVAYESLQIHRGGRNDSAIISGHKTTASTTSKTRALSDASYYGLQVDGKRSVRAMPDLFLRVGDVATFDGQELVIGQILYMVDTGMAIMQITEA